MNGELAPQELLNIHKDALGTLKGVCMSSLLISMPYGVAMMGGIRQAISKPNKYMARIYRVKIVPQEVIQYFQKHFPYADGFSYKFYWYKGMNGKIYGCEVFKNGEFWHNATQATIGEFVQMI